jgi:hypothetical protein
VSERGSAITTWHACGFALANAGKDTRSLQACPEQKNIRHTVKYTEPAPSRFKGGGKINVFPAL